MNWRTTSPKEKKTKPTKKNDMDSSARLIIGLIVIAITGAINYGCLISIYKIIMRDLRITIEDLRFIGAVYLGAILLSGISIICAVALLLIESGYVERCAE